MAAYPREVPSGTAIPAWAFLNITVLDRFTAGAAQALVGQPDLTIGTPQSTISSSQTTSSGSPTTQPSSSSSTESSTPTSSQPQPSSKDDTPAIVGGVVGGVVGLGLIVCLFIFLMKHNQTIKAKKRAPSAEFTKMMPPGSPVPANFDTAAVGFRSGTTSPLMGHGLNDSSGSGYPMGNVYHSNTTVGASLGGSPWSPPPVGHTPAPNAAPYPNVFTPAPQSVSPRLNHLNYTPPPGSMMSGVSSPYPNSLAGSASHGQPFQIPYGGNGPHGAGVAPEM
ncbi:hypothetical protein PIIN_03978 [Serendipita indica DSM 11827]|uniref:Uncharacterized protein n=1 Tax=Serendipita indica (strain DSM 11827) TaxID=1109443 RepID=G4TFD6_SERID|nr:hypothetical protein PIIN_03978 [Serendipita indica DSM 11827]